MSIMVLGFLCFANLIISVSRLKHSWSLLDIIWNSLGCTLQFQVRGAPALCLYPTGHLCLASRPSPVLTQHLPKWVVAICSDSRDTGAWDRSTLHAHEFIIEWWMEAELQLDISHPLFPGILSKKDIEAMAGSLLNFTQPTSDWGMH